MSLSGCSDAFETKLQLVYGLRKGGIIKLASPIDRTALETKSVRETKFHHLSQATHI